MLLATSLVLLVPLTASAQGPVEDAAASPVAPAPTTTSSAPERAVRGPAVRERGGRRSRAGSTASGVLMLTILIGAMGYYVMKRLRR